MIASMLKLNRNDCKELRLDNAYSIHRIVYSIFPQQENLPRDFLFADKGGDWNSRHILILSEREPAAIKYGELHSREVPESFLEGEYYRFEVILNPIQRNGPSKKTIPIRGIENLHNWFIQKAPAYGFEVEPESLLVSHIGVLVFEKIKENKTYKQTHGTATFTGMLKVINRQEFINSFKHGIGRAKGFGFGLLQIVPIQK